MRARERVIVSMHDDIAPHQYFTPSTTGLLPSYNHLTHLTPSSPASCMPRLLPIRGRKGSCNFVQSRDVHTQTPPQIYRIHYLEPSHFCSCSQSSLLIDSTMFLRRATTRLASSWRASGSSPLPLHSRFMPKSSLPLIIPQFSQQIRRYIDVDDITGVQEQIQAQHIDQASLPRVIKMSKYVSSLTNMHIIVLQIILCTIGACLSDVDIIIKVGLVPSFLMAS